MCNSLKNNVKLMMNNNAWVEMPVLSVSWGEVFDKLTILNIKLEKITDYAKLSNIQREKKKIEAVIGDMNCFPAGLVVLVEQLQAQNLRLWVVEDGKRECERQKRFGEMFVSLAREVYIGNDHRAKIKRQINELLGSVIVEEKSYQAY